MQRSFADLLLLLITFGAFGIALLFDILIPILPNHPQAKSMLAYWISSAISVILAAVVLILRKRSNLKKTTLGNIMLYPSAVLMAAQIALLGGLGRYANVPFILDIFFAAMFGGPLNGLLMAGVSSLCIGSLIVVQMLNPEIGQIAFLVGENPILTMCVHLIFFMIFAYFFGMASKVISEIDKFKQDMANTHVHEFRTPLGVISNSLGTIVFSVNKIIVDFSEYFKGLRDSNVVLPFELIRSVSDASESIKNSCQNINSYSARLDKMTDRFLSISRLESEVAVFKFSKCDLREVAKIAFEFQEVAAKIKGFELALKVPKEAVMSEIDEELIFILLNNLCSNAFEHAGKAGLVTIELNVFEDYATLGVRDCGQKIKPELVKKLSARETVFSTKKNKLGGHGLYAVKLIAAKHRGNFFVESQPDSGNFFGIKLPIPKEA